MTPSTTAAGDRRLERPRERARCSAGGRLSPLLSVWALIICDPAWGQQDQRPGARLPEPPEYAAPSSGARILPPVPLPDGSSTRSLEAGRRVFVRDYRLSGNTVLADDELAPLLAPYANREVSFEELAELRDALTRAYVERGYVSSGAVIPPQTLEHDVLEIVLVEGVLVDVKVQTDGRLRESYLRKRIQRGVIDPVNVTVLEERLQILQQDERVARIEASLTPAEQRGESVLDLSVTEATPYSFYLEASNYESPSVGAVRGLVRFTHRNVTGFGDRVSATYRQSKGLRGIEGSYAVPLNAHDTALELHSQYASSDVVEEPFDELDIESRSQTHGMTLSHPLYRTPSRRLSISATGEYRRSKSFLSGSPVSFSQGVERGVSKVAVVRVSQDASLRKPRQALAVRSTLSVGLDALGATRNSGNTPDGQFVSWLGQLQYVQRAAWLDTQIIVRAAAQISDSPLLGLEQFPLGGHASVRGYRENAVVRDNGAVASLEARIPVLRRSVGVPLLQVGPFVDVGHAWDSEGAAADETLLAVGIGARWAVTNNIVLEGTWAESVRDLPSGGEHDPQDSGLQLRLSAAF
ncbi:MAG: ShlB/FhaC/HecB family hemolysin secretion/activation protein [Gammaproteobacteria bacterium]